MLVRYLLLGVLIGIGHSQVEVDDDDDFDIDFTDEFLKGSENKPEEEDPAGLPTWFVKIKSILNKDVDPSRCSSRRIHDRFGDHGYFFSWEDPKSTNLELNWIEAREFCRARCMDVVSIETRRENEFIKQRLLRGYQKYVWTSGRKCNFIGCDRPDLTPHDIFGWFWSGSLQRMPPTTNRLDTDWSDTGGLGRPQPDNREHLQGGQPEDCLAILNNLYNDGVKWHDAACHHRMPFICEDSEQLLEDIEYNSESEEEKEKLPAVEKPHVQPQPQPHPLPIAPDSHHTNPHRPTVEELTPIIAPEGMITAPVKNVEPVSLGSKPVLLVEPNVLDQLPSAEDPSEHPFSV